MTSALPLNIGVTGHRDIPHQDRPKLANAVAAELKLMQKQHPSTTINLLCGLAEGADQIAASVAINEGVNLIAVLPFEQSEYEKDFTSPEALNEFRQLLQQCSEVHICDKSEQTHRDEGYIELGRTLVRCCDIVFAMWDGVMQADADNDNVAKGGTADVVTMCIEGIMDNNSVLFSKPNKTHCKWLVANRDKHDSGSGKIHSESATGTWKALPISGNQDDAVLQEILTKIDRFNLDASTISEQDKNQSIEYLLGSNKITPSLEPIAKLINAYSLADCLAQARQRQRSLSLILITVLSFFAITAQQVYVGPVATLGWYFTHIILVLVVIVTYRLFFVGTQSKEEQFVERRVFAENLRVQIFWHIAGIGDNCANNYRTTKFNEMDWIIDNLNKISFNIEEPASADVDFVKKHWVTDQRDYFYGQEGKSGRAAQLMAKSRQYKRCTKIFFILALILMALSTFKIEFNLLPAMSDNMLFMIVGLLFISSALFKTFSVQMGFEELSQRYLRTGYFFQQALKRMDLLDKKFDPQTAEYVQKHQNIIRIIGLEALNENAAWLQLHKMNAYEVQIN